ncbi:MAG: hypothetical protein GY841_16905 [FCB group bacterium]|nr:hypothetical protein [FCB group bacterium]
MDNINNRKKKIEDEVQKTLRNLDHLEDIHADASFFAAVQERINSTEADQAPWLYRMLVGYRLAPAILAVFIVLNVVTAFFVVSGQDDSAYERQTSIEAVASDYLISGLSTLSELDSE